MLDGVRVMFFPRYGVFRAAAATTADLLAPACAESVIEFHDNGKTKRNNLEVGMICTIVYKGNGAEAGSVACQ